MLFQRRMYKHPLASHQMREQRVVWRLPVASSNQFETLSFCKRNGAYDRLCYDDEPYSVKITTSTERLPLRCTRKTLSSRNIFSKSFSF